MNNRVLAWLLGILGWLVAVLTSPAASVRSTNFLVEAPTSEIAQQICRYAEHYRKEKALLWIGSEMPNWSQPCPIHVTVTSQGSGGATTFQFDSGRVLSQSMQIEGSLDRLLSSVLPHEVTHTVFAYYFRQPVPRWADEGSAVLSEDDTERTKHDRMCKQILTSGRGIPLRRLFALTDYPSDVMALYSEGFSVTSFLVAKDNRNRFLGFIREGMGQTGWDQAAKRWYGYADVVELEKDWLNSLRGAPTTASTTPSSTIPVSSSPPTQQGSLSDSAKLDKILVALQEVKGNQAQERADIDQLKSRMDRLEASQRTSPSPPTSVNPSGIPTQIQPWNNQPQRTQPGSIQGASIYAQPTPWSPGGGSFPQGNCPGGVCPAPGRR